jgi:outer membrane murein-binding lipoprotein Lpp
MNLQKRIRAVCATLIVITLLLIAGQSIRAQSPNAQNPPTDVQQLKDKVDQLEKMVKDLNEQIKTLKTEQTAGDKEEVNKNTDVGPFGIEPTAAATPAAPAAPNAPNAPAPPQLPAEEKKNNFEIYGFAMLDMGYEVNQNDPLWFDVLRPSKLPAFPDEFGPDGRTFFGVRQSRLGVRSSTETCWGDLKTIFEFELFGTGVDAGQTTFRLRHAYGELGQVGAGQTWSAFMDPDVFPNQLEYWGPNGMVFFRNVQVRWMPIKGRSRVTLALERPGASADQGIYIDRIELQGVKPKFDYPDLTGQARLGRDWGYVQASGIVRSLRWVDLNNDKFDLGGSAVGWGASLSSNLNFRRFDSVGKFEVTYGRGIENYMNDAPVDVGIKNNFNDPRKPVMGVPLPVFGVVAFLDHNWNKCFTSTMGYSMLEIKNSDAQLPSAFRRGHYALMNLEFHPTETTMVGAEFQWGRRVNFQDHFAVNDYRVQISFKFDFSKTFKY